MLGSDVSRLIQDAAMGSSIAYAVKRGMSNEKSAVYCVGCIGNAAVDASAQPHYRSHSVMLCVL